MTHILSVFYYRYANPFLLEAATVLVTFVHPNHIVYPCDWGFAHLPPTYNFKWFGYKDISGFMGKVLFLIYITHINLNKYGKC